MEANTVTEAGVVVTVTCYRRSNRLPLRAGMMTERQRSTVQRERREDGRIEVY